MLFGQAAIEVTKVGDFQEMEAIQPQVKALYEQGLIHVEDGREDALRIDRALAAQTSETDFERRLNEVLTELLADNVPKAFDVEERILIEIYEFVTTLETLDEDYLDDFMMKMELLEGERARLTLERQHRIAEIE